MRKMLLLLFFILLVTTTFAQAKHRFAWGKKDFLPDGNPFQIISGEMHPARIPMQYWRHIQMVDGPPGEQTRKNINSFITSITHHY